MKIITIEFPEKQTVLKVPVRIGSEKRVLGSVMSQFKLPNTIESDIISLGYNSADVLNYRKMDDGKASLPYKTEQFPWGVVYSWRTPTKGSSTFSYVCRSKEDYCFKVGPYGGSAIMELDWAHATFENAK